MSVVIAFVLIGLSGSVKASHIQYYFPPYSASTFRGISTAQVGCGANDVFVYPTAYSSNGRVVMNTGSRAAGCGAVAINAWAGFWGPTFTATSSGFKTITYKWQIWWDASIGTSLCFFGSNAAEGWIRFYANLYDATARAWKLNGDKAATVWNVVGFCGVIWAGWQDGAVYYITFSAYLVAGHTYQFYTYLMTHALADAVGFATANAVNNVGSAGDQAYLRYMKVS